MSTVTVEKDGHVLLIGVDRAAKRNAWNLAVIEEVAAAYEQLATDDDVRVGVVFGHGDHFSAGLDLAEVLPAVQEHGPSVLSGKSLHDPFGLWGPPVPSPSSWRCRASPSRCRSSWRWPATSWWPRTTCASASSRSAAGSCRSAGRRCGRPRSWAGATRCAGSSRGGARRGRGAPDRARPGGRAGRPQLARATEIAQLIAKQAPLGVYGSLANARHRLPQRGGRPRAPGRPAPAAAGVRGRRRGRAVRSSSGARPLHRPVAAAR
jgi:hypothetical protein